MGIFKQLFLVCTIWCFLDYVHSIPTHPIEGSSLRQPLVAKPPFVGGHKEICGKSKKFNADKLSIVGGDEAVLGDWPWMVALFTGSPKKPSSHCQCGGSLISKEWVITAAHCVEDMPEGRLFVRLGDLDLDDQVKDGAAPVDVEIAKIVSHPKYNNFPSTNDIALIRLKTPVHFTENISPICIPNGQKYKNSTFYNGKQAFITGWGRTGFQQKVSTRLLETTVSMVPKEKCVNQYSNMTEDFLIDEMVVCAADPGKDTCQGDSGGPLVLVNTVNEEKRFYLGGITSGGYKCALENYSGVYTKVAQFTCWISDITGEDF